MDKKNKRVQFVIWMSIINATGWLGYLAYHILYNMLYDFDVGLILVFPVYALFVTAMLVGVYQSYKGAAELQRGKQHGINRAILGFVFLLIIGALVMWGHLEYYAGSRNNIAIPLPLAWLVFNFFLFWDIYKVTRTRTKG